MSEARKPEAGFPKRKISEAFLAFVQPLLNVLGPQAGVDHVKGVLQLAFTVQNGVVLDGVNGEDHYVGQIRKAIAKNPVSANLVEQLISRKRLEFGDDQRVVGHYELLGESGNWRLRVEAGEVTESLRDYDSTELKRRCVRWAQDHFGPVSEAKPALPEELNDLQKDIWEPLFPIAHVVGG